MMIVVASLALFGVREYGCKLRREAFARRIESLKRDAAEELKIGASKNDVARFFTEHKIPFAILESEAYGSLRIPACAPLGCFGDSAFIGISVKLDDAGTVTEVPKVFGMYQDSGGRGLALDVAILHRVFGIAVECEMIGKNPVRVEGRPGDSAERGAQPFTGEQLTKLRQAANEDLLAYLLLRWTGLRGSDAVRLTWDEIDWGAREINRLTQKRKKRVVLPIPQEVFFALESERDRRMPQFDERILMNPRTGEPMTRPRLYQRMLSLGKRAGVPDAHPHRYRDSFAVDMLARGASPYDVAKLLGDTVATVEKHYAPFVKELRDRARRIMENGEGLEKTHCTNLAQSAEPKGRIQ
jgi:hypothetical protein